MVALSECHSLKQSHDSGGGGLIISNDQMGFMGHFCSMAIVTLNAHKTTGH